MIGLGRLAIQSGAGRTSVAKSDKRRRRTSSELKPRKTPRVRVDRGTLQTRLHHARAFLGIKDRLRLEMLVNIPAEQLRAAGAVELPKSKRILTDTEEWEAIRAAVTAECETLFAKAANAPHAAQRKDPIGRAWYDGLLDGHGVDPVVMRELGREYGWLYWSELKKLDASIGGYDEMIGRNKGFRKFYMCGNAGSAAARWVSFERTLAPLGGEVRRCLQKLCVDEIWWIEGPAWLERCINSHRQARLARGERCDPVNGHLARGYDTDTLANAIAALRALAVGVGR